MELYLAAVLFVIISAVLTALIIRVKKSGIKKWTIAAIVVLSLALLALLFYAVSTLILIRYI